MVQFHTGNNPKITLSQRLEKKDWLEFWKSHCAKQTLLWDFWNLPFLLRLEGGKAHELSLKGDFCTWEKSRLCRSGGLAQAYSRQYNCNYFTLDFLIIPLHSCLRSKPHWMPSWVISTPKLVSKCCCLFYQTTSSSLLSHGCCYFKLLKN